MKKKRPNNNQSHAYLKDLSHRLHEAETYTHQGLFAEAKKVYTKILDAYPSAGSRNLNEKDSDIDLLMSEHVQSKIKEIDELENEKSSPQPEADSEFALESDSASHYYNKGIAFKEIGFFEQAIVNFKKAEKQGYRTSDCLVEIGDALIRKGQISEGIDTLRLVYVNHAPDASQKINILEKITAAYETSLTHMRKAKETHQEMALLDTLPPRDVEPPKQPSDIDKKISFLTLTRHRWVVLFFSSLIAVALIAFNPFVKIVENVDYFTIKDSQDAIFYDSFKEIFGSDEFFVIAYEANDLFSADNLNMLKAITDELEMVEEIRDVTSLTNVDDTIGEKDYFEVRRFIEEIPEAQNELNILKDNAIKNHLYVDALISKDGNTTAILIEAYEDKDDPNYRKILIEKTKSILSKYEQDGIQFFLAGDTIINFTLSQYMNADMAVFVPITYCLITFTIWFFFRNVPLTIVALLNISVCVGATRGFMGLTGLTLNNVTSIVIPLVMALSLCDTVHIFSHMNKRVLDELPNRYDALAHVLRQVALPCFMTTLTTAVGFLSLSVSHIPAIREFAWAASAGMAFEFFFSFFFLPPLLLFFQPSKIYQSPSSQSTLMQVLDRIWNVVYRKHILVLSLSALLVIVAIGYAGQMKVETNMVDFFKDSSPIRVAIDFVEKRLSGVSTFDISLKAQNEDAFKFPENLKVIEQIQDYLVSQKGVDKTFSFVDLLKDMNESFNNEDEAFFRIPVSREMVAQYLLLYDSAEIEDFVNNTFDHARISVRISEHNSSKQKEMIDSIKRYINDMNRRGLDIRITGRTVSQINTVDDLVQGQVLSLALAALIISVVMVFVFKSISLATLSMLPNFFPIVINFGVMGLLHIPLDTGTALIAAVALGIAVDDTIHFLSEYQRHRKQGQQIHSSIKAATMVKGRAILTSSLILSIGFGVTMLSRFVPIVHFGLLTALIMLTAVIGDLVVLPSILYLKKDKMTDMISERTVLKT